MTSSPNVLSKCTFEQLLMKQVSDSVIKMFIIIMIINVLKSPKKICPYTVQFVLQKRFELH